MTIFNFYLLAGFLNISKNYWKDNKSLSINTVSVNIYMNIMNNLYCVNICNIFVNNYNIYLKYFFFINNFYLIKTFLPNKINQPINVYNFFPIRICLIRSQNISSQIQFVNFNSFITHRFLWQATIKKDEKHSQICFNQIEIHKIKKNTWKKPNLFITNEAA